MGWVRGLVQEGMGEDFGKGVGLWLGGGRLVVDWVYLYLASTLRLNDYFYTFGRVDYDVK